MTVSETEFRAALLDPRLPVPDGLRSPNGKGAGARFSVYRNNVIVSLTEALATAFPLLRKLIGGESFARLAAIFVRAHPPSSPLMMFYGEALPDFLVTFEPLRHIGYLPDCARLDLALRHSYHAADAIPLNPQVLAGDEDASSKRLGLAPAVRVLRSEWPLFDIWRYNNAAGAPKPRALAQDVLVARPGFDPLPHPLPPGGASWLAMLAAGTPLGEASDRTLRAEPAFDLTAALTLAMSTGALIDSRTKETG